MAAPDSPSMMDTRRLISGTEVVVFVMIIAARHDHASVILFTPPKLLSGSSAQRFAICRPDAGSQLHFDTRISRISPASTTGSPLFVEVILDGVKFVTIP